MRDDTVGDVDGKVIRRIARASLREEDKVPGSIVGGTRLREGGQGNKRECGRHVGQGILHHDDLRSVISVAADIWEGRARMLVETCFNRFAIAVTLSVARAGGPRSVLQPDRDRILGQQRSWHPSIHVEACKQIILDFLRPKLYLVS